TPTTRPGARAPDGLMGDGRPVIDLFGRGFVLLRLGASPPRARNLEDAAAARGVPLRTMVVADPEIAELYETALVLVRPDGHVAWRGQAPPDDAVQIIDRVRGAL
ncbi:MAG: hypothetical protein V3R63_03480, partial [Alphaproteobacteria bacterium]